MPTMESPLEIVEKSIITDIDQAKELWEKFSPSNTLYSNWNFRYLFSNLEGITPHFIVVKYSDSSEALLPLQWHSSKNRLEFWGGTYMEENSVLPNSISTNQKKALYELLTPKYFLSDITSNDPDTEDLGFEEFKYTTSLAGLSNAEDFLNRQFTGKTKNNFKKRIKAVKERGVTIRRGDATDLKQLMAFNIQNFGEDSSFFDIRRQEIFLKLLETDLSPTLLVFEMEGVTGGVSLGLTVNHIYYYINSGVDKLRFPNLGTYLILTNIEEAIRQKCNIFDAGVEDLGWKERWHFDRLPQYKLENF